MKNENVQAGYEESAAGWDETFGADKLNPRHVRSCWRIFRRMLGEDHGRGIAVELGVGTGLFTDRLAPRFERLLAVDFSHKMLETLRVKMQRQGIDNVDYVFARAEALESVQSGTIDAVFCFGLLENIKDLAPLFRETARILKPGGCFAGVASNGACPWYTIRRRLKPDAWYWADVQLHTADRLREAAEAAGLAVEAIEGWGLIPSQIPDSPLLAPVDAVERIIEKTPLRRWMGGLAFRVVKK